MKPDYDEAYNNMGNALQEWQIDEDRGLPESAVTKARSRTSL